MAHTRELLPSQQLRCGYARGQVLVSLLLGVCLLLCGISRVFQALAPKSGMCSTYARLPLAPGHARCFAVSTPVQCGVSSLACWYSLRDLSAWNILTIPIPPTAKLTTTPTEPASNA